MSAGARTRLSPLLGQHHPRYVDGRAPLQPGDVDAPLRWRELHELVEHTQLPSQRIAAGVGVLVYGATGRTGRAVIDELLRAGVNVVACGRNGPALAELAGARPGVRAHQAALTHAPSSLHEAMRGCRLAIQCAPLPEPLLQRFVQAAISEGLDYIDVAAERAKVEALTRQHHAEARRRGVMLCLGVAPIGGALGEWLGIAAASRLGAGAGAEAHELHELSIAHATESLPPSIGSWRSSLNMLRQQLLDPRTLRRIDCPPPFGHALGIEFPFGGRATLARRFPTAQQRSLAVLKLGSTSRSLPTPGPSCDESPLCFAVVAHAVGMRGRVAVGLSGHWPYLTTARLVRLVAARMSAGPRSAGVVAVSDLIDWSQALRFVGERCGMRVFVSA